MIHYIKKLQAQDAMIHQYTTEISELNFMVFRILTFVSLIINIIMSVTSFIPNTILYKTNFRIFFVSSFFFIVIACIAIHYMKNFIIKHSMIFLYMRILLSQIFFILLDRVIAANRGHEVPYTLITGLLLIQPIITIDKNLRITLWTATVCAMCTTLSFCIKPLSVAINDLINCSLFTVIGSAIGIVMRTYIINYTAMTIRQKETDVQVAKKASLAKSEFLALVSHELRSPLNAVTGFNEMILRELTQSSHVPDKAELLDYSEKIKISCNTLTFIISDILDFSKINSGEFSLISTEYTLDTILNDLLNMIIPSAQEKNLEFGIKLKEDTPNKFVGDDMRLKQCLMNLLLNAVKYTNEGKVSLSIDWKNCESDENEVLLTFSVSDTGTGIKEEDIKKITSPFERLDEMKKRGIDGTGLGLSIVVGILKKMNSQLDIKSEYGIGSRFSFTIKQKTLGNNSIGEYNIQSRLAEYGAPSAYRSFVAPEARILVVDDLQMNLLLICSLLKCTQIQIDTATSGKKALELINMNHYNVVFIDHLMPVMDGIETLHAIRIMNISNYSDTKYIALTANAAKDSRQIYINEGFDDYLSKPVDCEELEKMLIRNLPPELVTLTDSNKQYTEAGFLELYKSIKDTDCDMALKYCRNEQILQDNIRLFCEDIDERIQSLKNNLAKSDMKNYTITVHALKTALRLIGLTKLSERAAFLEQCGNSSDEKSLNEHTEDFIFQIKQKAELLSHTCFGQTCQKQELSPISDNEYNEALNSLSECAQSRDFRTAGRILKMMAEYKLPDKDSEMIHSLNQAVRNKNAEFFTQIMKEGIVQ